MQKKFLSNLVLIIFLNLLVKPVAIFGIDAAVQNRVGTEEYGLYFSLLNFTFLFNILLDLGINNFTTKNVAQHPEIVPKYLGKVLSLRFILFIIYALVSCAIALLIGYSERAFYILGFLIVNQFFITIIAYVRSHFAGMHLFKTDAIISVLDRLLLIVFCGMLLYGSASNEPFQIDWFVWLQTLCYGITCVVGITLLIYKIGRPIIRFHRPFSLAILRQSLPFALLILLMMLYTRIDSVMIERLHVNGQFEAGIYAQGFRLLDAFFMFGMIFTNLLFPIFARMLQQKDSITDLLNMSAKLLIFGALSIAVICFWNGETILSWIYTTDVSHAILPFQLLMFTFVGMCITLIYGTLLTASGKLKLLNRIAFVGIICNGGINWFLIPKYGAVGAAIATLMTQTLIGFIQWLVVVKRFQIHMNWNGIIQSVSFVLTLVAVVWLTDFWKVHVAFQLLCVAFLLLFFRVVNLKDIKGILQKGE